ncbi:hypothetical protein UREG_07730 [Uncinocarpus reesii 1704]|uniref:EGF-like domain-containing protein n=1 Tax=Uncinocarpus reesii (strain UAMH 1704) TaxID=336963 RepID=C4JZX9_UNCRE|nr:uncharacterized protein UREG_07730 [Uncinocarpus reesii 1704]EEP82865.1 hypothetical protein UREG_07730 [Uncinocarpus reesii 1704]
MHTFKTLGALFLLATTTLALSPPICPTCNPISGQNNCDPTTSCISTGKNFHCACRAGYKAFAGNDARQFRLPFKNYEFLVFTHEKTECNVLCKDYTQPPPYLVFIMGYIWDVTQQRLISDAVTNQRTHNYIYGLDSFPWQPLGYDHDFSGLF